MAMTAETIKDYIGLTVLHDENGNITSWGDKSFIWDSRDRLVEVKEGGNTIAAFKYDALGRRAEKTINGNTTKYLYDGADIVMEMDGNNVATAYYVRTLNIDEPLARIDISTGEIRFYIADALGSVIALTDENGVVKTRYNYTPFGEVEVTGEASENPFMFTGREWDGATGLYFYRARYYSPVMGRFISEDPIGLMGGINYFAYVGNSPVNFTDPLGLFGWDVHYLRTKQLALEAGFEEREAELIAKSNQGFDDDFFGSGPWTHPWLHFMSREDAVDHIKEAMRNKDLIEFGRGLHMLQDYYSHYMQDYRWYKGGHIPHGHKPDKTYSCPNTSDMVSDSLYFMKMYRGANR